MNPKQNQSNRESQQATRSPISPAPGIPALWYAGVLEKDLACAKEIAHRLHDQEGGLNDRTVKHLLRYLRGKNDILREGAVIALSEIRSETAIADLVKIQSESTFPATIRAAIKVLGSCNSPVRDAAFHALFSNSHRSEYWQDGLHAISPLSTPATIRSLVVLSANLNSSQGELGDEIRRVANAIDDPSLRQELARSAEKRLLDELPKITPGSLPHSILEALSRINNGTKEGEAAPQLNGQLVIDEFAAACCKTLVSLIQTNSPFDEDFIKVINDSVHQFYGILNDGQKEMVNREVAMYLKEPPDLTNPNYVDRTSLVMEIVGLIEPEHQAHIIEQALRAADTEEWLSVLVKQEGLSLLPLESRIEFAFEHTSETVRSSMIDLLQSALNGPEEARRITVELLTRASSPGEAEIVSRLDASLLAQLNDESTVTSLVPQIRNYVNGEHGRPCWHGIEFALDIASRAGPEHYSDVLTHALHANTYLDREAALTRISALTVSEQLQLLENAPHVFGYQQEIIDSIIVKGNLDHLTRLVTLTPIVRGHASPNAEAHPLGSAVNDRLNAWIEDDEVRGILGDVFKELQRAPRGNMAIDSEGRWIYFSCVEWLSESDPERNINAIRVPSRMPTEPESLVSCGVLFGSLSKENMNYINAVIPADWEQHWAGGVCIFSACDGIPVARISSGPRLGGSPVKIFEALPPYVTTLPDESAPRVETNVEPMLLTRGDPLQTGDDVDFVVVKSSLLAEGVPGFITRKDNEGFYLRAPGIPVTRFAWNELNDSIHLLEPSEDQKLRLELSWNSLCRELDRWLAEFDSSNTTKDEETLVLRQEISGKSRAQIEEEEQKREAELRRKREEQEREQKLRREQEEQQHRHQMHHSY